MKNRFTDEDEGENDDNDEKGKKKRIREKVASHFHKE